MPILEPDLAEPDPVLLSWSGGKDSALALHALQSEGRYEVVGLLCTVSQEYGRVSHHGVREELVEMQAEALGLPLHKLLVPPQRDVPCMHGRYQEMLREVLEEFRSRGIRHVAHGDIHLADLRAYRERNLRQVDMQGVFPLWGRQPRDLVRELVALGFRATVCCVEPVLGRSFVGQELGESFFGRLPPGVDPCGEHGEYHSFVWDGPVFREPVGVRVGEIVERDGRFLATVVLAEHVLREQRDELAQVLGRHVGAREDLREETAELLRVGLLEELEGGVDLELDVVRLNQAGMDDLAAAIDGHNNGHYGLLLDQACPTGTSD